MKELLAQAVEKARIFVDENDDETSEQFFRRIDEQFFRVKSLKTSQFN